jgi:hypothetical protein
MELALLSISPAVSIRPGFLSCGSEINQPYRSFAGKFHCDRLLVQSCANNAFPRKRLAKISAPDWM